MTRPGIVGVEEVEAWGVLEALQWILQLGLSRVVVEFDAKLVRDVLIGNTVDRSSFGAYIDSARIILRNNPLFFVNLIFRDANVVSHTLARSSRAFGSPST